MGSELSQPSAWLLIPFGVLLAGIALGPAVCPNWWARHYPKVAWALGALTLGYYLFVLGAGREVLHVAHDYISFMVLIAALYVVAGGIHINVKGEATPLANTVYLLAGGVLSNLLGTTGASMLLVRPWLRMNRYRVTEHHVVFFIFIVSNVGGCLTPVGDPPLFLGYLQGVPFWWVTRHCWPMWALGMGFLLALFFILDWRNYRRAPRAVREVLAEAKEQWRFEGLGNLGWLAIVLGAVFVQRPVLLREGIMAVAAAASYFSTRKEVHVSNHFGFHPIVEVAILFSGIFATMMPALDWLHAHAASFGHPSPGLFYWSSGGLSSCLDNAPTYLSFFSAAQGLFPGATGLSLAANTPFEQRLFGEYILAISIGSVFFGASTYIGNGPNFMVKAIAHQQKVRTPGFVRFILRYTLPCMGPLLALIWWLFFR